MADTEDSDNDIPEETTPQQPVKTAPAQDAGSTHPESDVPAHPPDNPPVASTDAEAQPETHKDETPAETHSENHKDAASSAPPAEVKKSDIPLFSHPVVPAGIGWLASVYDHTKPVRAASSLAREVKWHGRVASVKFNWMAWRQERLATKLSQPTSWGKFRQALHHHRGTHDEYASKLAAKAEDLGKRSAAMAEKEAETLKGFAKKAAQTKNLKPGHVGQQMADRLNTGSAEFEKAAADAHKLVETSKNARTNIAHDIKTISAETKNVTSGLSSEATSLRSATKGLADGVKDLKVIAGTARGAEYMKGAGKVLGRVALPLAVAFAGYEIYEGYKTGDNKKFAAAGGNAVGGLLGGYAGAQAGAAIGAGIGTLFGGVGAIPGAVIGGIVGGVAGALSGSWGGRKIAAVAVGAPDETHTNNAPAKAGNTPVNTKTSSRTDAEWTALNMQRLKTNTLRGDQSDIETVAKGYGFDNAKQAHWALNTLHVESAGEMKTLMQAAANAHAASTEAFLKNRNGHELAVSLSRGASLSNDKPVTPSTEKHDAGDGVKTHPATADNTKHSPLGTPREAHQEIKASAPPATQPAAAAAIHKDYSLTSKDNFGGKPELAQRLEATMKSARDGDGKLYSEYDDVKKAATASEKTTMAWQHYLKDNGHPDLKADGKMGSLTRQASLEFTKNVGNYAGAVRGSTFDAAALTSIDTTLKNASLFEPLKGETVAETLPKLETIPSEPSGTPASPSGAYVSGNAYRDVMPSMPVEDPASAAAPALAAKNAAPASRNSLRDMYSGVGKEDVPSKKPDPALVAGPDKAPATGAPSNQTARRNPGYSGGMSA